MSIMEEVIAKGDLAKLSPDQLAVYYAEVCRSMGLNELTQPFQYITLNGKLTLYATKTATDQLRTVRGVSVFRVEAETTTDGIRIVTAYARDKDGREDMDLGSVNVKGLAGEALANAYMKALTKAKRRVTLSICGLGWLDESEIDSVPTARHISVNVETGEIVDATSAAPESPQSDVPMITDRQIKKIAAIASEIGMSHEQVRAMHGKASAKDLTRGEASVFIDRLQAVLDDLLGRDDDDIQADAAQEAFIDTLPLGDDSGMGANPDRWTR